MNQTFNSMKTLTEMKKRCCMNRFSLLIVAIGLVIGLSSCGDDDSKIPTFTIKDVEGSYKGKMLTSQPQIKSTGETAEGADITAKVKDRKLSFDKFPVEDLIKSIVGEEAAAPIIAAIGNVTYEVAFDATFNENKNDAIHLKLDPKPLELNFEIPASTSEGEPIPFNVKVTITADQQGIFTYATKKLELSLHATQVTLNGNPFDLFKPTTFKFNLNKE